MESLVCIQDFENRALEILDKNSRNYFKSGADDEISVRENQEAFLRWLIRPRMLRDVSVRTMSKNILGTRVSAPVGVSPTAFQSLVNPEAEILNARAAASLGTIFVLSTFSNWSIEEVAKRAKGGRKWFQLFPNTDKNVTLDLLQRAEASGYEAIVVTLDAQNFGKKRDTMRDPFIFPSHLRVANLEPQSDDDPKVTNISAFVHSTLVQNLTWDTISWIQSNTRLPVVLKGILTVEDAVLAVNHKVSAIWVSNHGGRQVDTAISPINALPDIVKAVQKLCEIYMDSGVRRGSDIFKALAIGADMVFVGRPLIWGIAVAGETGAKRVLEILQKELDLTMALSGVADVNEILPNYVQRSARSRL